ncbi:MAG TPA: ferritin family protein [Syntrophales bacterium]|jgi:rubrerythrin|nr:ferritin family protein [Syntrophales bacterium]HRT62624.1 ferritin family protein [Syntrophales bacterium]
MPKFDICVIDFAMQAEKDGVSFYTKAADTFKEKDLRALFLKLAKDEARHLEEFISLKEKALKKGVEECFLSVEVGDYLNAVAREGVFPKGEDIARKLEAVRTVEDACKIALQAERNAILLYTELVKLSKDKDQKKILEKLLEEEKSHLVRITSLRADYDPMYMFSKFGRD